MVTSLNEEAAKFGWLNLIAMFSRIYIDMCLDPPLLTMSDEDPSGGG